MPDEQQDQKWEWLKHPLVVTVFSVALTALLITHTIVFILSLSWWLILLDILLILTVIGISSFIVTMGRKMQDVLLKVIDAQREELLLLRKRLERLQKGGE